MDFFCVIYRYYSVMGLYSGGGGGGLYSEVYGSSSLMRLDSVGARNNLNA